MTSEFGAPLSARVRATSWLGAVVLLGEAALMLAISAHVPRALATIFLAVGLALLLVFCTIGLFAIRGYRLEPGVLRVYRPLWSTSHSLAGLTQVERDPSVLRFTWLGFGNNGLFAVNGWRKVTPYGWCRVMATNADNAVVLRAAGGTYVVTPDRPDEFVQRARAFAAPAP